MKIAAIALFALTATSCCEGGATVCYDQCGGNLVANNCGNQCQCACPAGSVNPDSCASMPDGGADSGATDTHGSATLLGAGIFPIRSAIARTHLTDAGADLSSVQIDLSEAPYECWDQTVVLIAGSDAGQQRSVFLSLQGASGSPFPTGRYGVADAGTNTASVALGPPGGTGFYTSALDSLITIDALDAHHVRGSFSARFDDDAGETLGAFDALICGTYQP